MSELILREDAEKFLKLIDADRVQWRFRAEHEDGRAEEIIATFDDVFSKLCELNRSEFDIFVSADEAHLITEVPVHGTVPPCFQNLYFFAALAQDDPTDDPYQLGAPGWEGLMPHIAVTVGPGYAQYVWRVTGLHRDLARCLKGAVAWSLGVGNETLSNGFAYLPGFGTRTVSTDGKQLPARIAQVRDGAPFNGVKAWKGYLNQGCYAGEALAEHERRHMHASTHGAGSGSTDDDERVQEAMRAAAEAGVRVPARTGTHANAWGALRAFPELGAALASRKGRDRVHASLMRLLRANKLRRVEGRTAGRRECEFFEAALG